MVLMALPTYLNGYPVLAIRDRRRGDGTYVVLVNRGKVFQPWVTAVWSPVLTDSWCWGHYISEEKDAWDSFNTR